MELRYLKRIAEYGDMLMGERHTYVTVLQYRVFKDQWSEWMDVETVKE